MVAASNNPLRGTGEPTSRAGVSAGEGPVVARRPPGEARTTLQLRRTDGTVLPLRFLSQGEAELVVAAAIDPFPQWAAELSSTREAVVRLPGDGGWRLAQVREVLEPTQRSQAHLGFRLLLGPEDWERYFGRGVRFLAMTLSRAVPPQDPSERVRQEFDALASSYADRLAHRPLQVYLRERALELLFRTFPRPGRLLELGPGTGAQTLPLLREGHQILAVDPAPRMLAELFRRAEAEGLGDRLTVRVGTAGALGESLADLPGAELDGAYSMFGALNLDEHLDRTPRALGRLVKPGAPFVAGLLNRSAVIAFGQLFAAGHYRLAFDRMKPRLEVEGFLHPLSPRPLTVREFGRIFSSDFTYRTTETLSVLAPPFSSPRLERFWGPVGLRRLARLDRRLVRHALLVGATDQVFVTLTRRG